MGIYHLIDDPIGFITSLLLSLPAILPALVLHEVAHGWVAYRLGDPTAKMLGRLSLDPRKHLDPIGTLMMFLVGLGWARPVPINPRNFKKPRRDDFLVSIAGITANFIMFLIGCIGIYLMILIGLRAVPADMWYSANEFLVELNGDFYGIPRADALTYAFGMGDYLITPYLGTTAGYLYQIVLNFATYNACLMVFNLLPVPPLDGFHVFNDLVLKKSLFAPTVVMRAGQGLMLVLLFTGLLDKGLNWVMDGLFGVVGRIALALLG